jgi:hypothetical protein
MATLTEAQINALLAQQTSLQQGPFREQWIRKLPDGRWELTRVRKSNDAEEKVYLDKPPNINVPKTQDLYTNYVFNPDGSYSTSEEVWRKGGSSFFGDIMSGLAGGIESVGGAVAKAGQQGLEAIDENMEPIMIAAAIATAIGTGAYAELPALYAAAGSAGMSASEIAAAAESATLAGEGLGAGAVGAGAGEIAAGTLTAADLGLADIAAGTGLADVGGSLVTEAGLADLGLTAADIAAMGGTGVTAAEVAGAGGVGTGTLTGADVVAPATVSSLATVPTAAAVTGSNVFPYVIGGTSVLNYIAQTQAAKDAAEAQLEATGSSNALLNTIDLRNRADLAPWREAGTDALGRLTSKVAAGPGDYVSSPYYNWLVGEGTKAIERSASARGGLLSGRTGKELIRYGENAATTDYDNWLRRYYESLNPDLSLAGLGQTSTGQAVTSGTNIAGQQAANTLAGGTAQAGQYINQANALTGAVNSGLNNYLMWKYLSQ